MFQTTNQLQFWLKKTLFNHVMLENPPKPLTDHDVPNVSVGTADHPCQVGPPEGNRAIGQTPRACRNALVPLRFFSKISVIFTECSPGICSSLLLLSTIFGPRNLLCLVCLLKFDCHCQCSDKLLLFCSSLPMQRKKKMCICTLHHSMCRVVINLGNVYLARENKRAHNFCIFVWITGIDSCISCQRDMRRK